MAISKVPIYQVTNSICISPFDLKTIIDVYLNAHGGRSIPYLFWSAISAKAKVLITVNKEGRDLNRVNDATLRCRMIRLYNNKHFHILSWLINEVLYSGVVIRRADVTVDIRKVLSALNDVNYDISQLEFKRLVNGNILVRSKRDEAKMIVVAYFNTDVQNTHLVSQLFNNMLSVEEGTIKEEDLAHPIEYIKGAKTVDVYLTNGKAVTMKSNVGIDYPTYKFHTMFPNNVAVFNEYTTDKTRILLNVFKTNDKVYPMNVYTQRIYSTFYITDLKRKRK